MPPEKVGSNPPPPRVPKKLESKGEVADHLPPPSWRVKGQMSKDELEIECPPPLWDSQMPGWEITSSQLSSGSGRKRESRAKTLSPVSAGKVVPWD